VPPPEGARQSRNDRGGWALKVIALIDGEHHPAVTRAALELLAARHEIQSVLFVGGQEKVAEGALDDPSSHFGVDVVDSGADVVADLRRLAEGSGAEAVVDLSGEPVLDGVRRHELASAALDRGLEYRAGGLLLTPPPLARLEGEVPIVGVIGTSKRCGKTAVAGHFARLLSATGLEPVIVAMGRGGPAKPTLVRAEERTDRARLLEIARAGGHAASDYLEDAALAGVATIGCRRCGEGPAGEVFDSNVVEGARLALTLEPDVVLLEGSGAAFPPVAADRTVCVVAAQTARVYALAFLGPFRLMRSQLVLLTGADELAPSELDALKAAIERWCGDSPVIACTLEPEPAEELPAGARVALFTTAPAGAEPRIRERLAERGVGVELFSPNLARREALERDIELAVRNHCDLFLTELKAAAVETVAERAERHGAGLVFLRNRPRSLDEEPGLDAELLALHEHSAAEQERRTAASRS
jgi:cyclic 2,3-diphosphoglycerate synthase